MTILVRNKNKNVDYLLGSNYEGIHARLVEVLGERRAALFAQPQNRRGRGEHWWYAKDGSPLTAFSAASEETKDDISDLLWELTEDVRGDIARDNELRGLGEKIFTFPDVGNLFFRDNGAGAYDLVICQWGCRRAGAVNDSGPLVHLVNRQKKDHSLVSLVVTDSTGDLYANRKLRYKYKGRDKHIPTDERGHTALGQVKNGGEIILAADDDGDFFRAQVIVNSEEQDLFSVVFPYFQDFKVKVVNQKGDTLSNYSVELETNGEKRVYQTDHAGEFIAQSIKLDGIPIKAYDTKDTTISQVLQVDKGTTEVVFRVTEKLFASVKLTLLTDAEEIVPDFNLNVIVDGQTRKVKSDAAGEVRLSDVPEHCTLLIQPQGRIVSHQEFSVSEGSHEFTVRVNPPIPNLVTVSLLDYDGKPLPNTAIDFSTPTHPLQRTTDDKGETVLQDPPFTDGEKVNVKVLLNREGKKTRKKSARLKFHEGQRDYVIQLKRRNWWWLLLFLLPLFLLPLLLEFDKNINVHTFDSGTGTDISGAQVEVSYVRHALYKTGSGFFVSDTIRQSDTSNTVGMTQFAGLNYTLYAALFARNTAFYVRAQTNCHDTGVFTERFYGLKKEQTLEVGMNAVLLPLDFQVVDTEDGQPLPNADFIFESEYYGQKRQESLKSDANGRVVINSLPKCGKLLQARASLYGFFPDSLAQTAIEALANADPERRILKLVPKKDNIAFFVVNCNNGEPIPNALVTIFVGKDKKGKKFYTNVDGKGKGSYDNLRILDSIRLEGQNPPYFKKGYWRREATVEQFVKLPDSLRVLCLEPEEQLIKFVDIDSLTGQPLKGVKNLIEVVSAGDTTEHELTSNGNGVIELPIKIGDKFSIRATHPPGYSTQDKKFRWVKTDDYITGKNRDVTIPLPPIMITHQFRTINPSSGQLVASAKLVVTIDGKTTTPTSSGNGQFSVTGPYGSRVSIVASKGEYETNDFTVKNVAFSVLKTKIPRVTDIPMKFPPCGVKTKKHKAAENYYRNRFQMGRNSGTFSFEYITYSKFDTITIYCGNTVEPRRAIWSNLPPNNPGVSKASVNISFNCSSSLITVEIKGSSAWDYTVNCP